MQDQALKSKVLQEIMDLMDKNEGDRLKAHPKLQVAKVEVENPAPGVDPVDGGGPVEEVKADEEVSPEMLEQLLALIKD